MSIVAAINTLEASDWTIVKVVLFGKKKIVREGDNEVVLRTYKGKDYLTATRSAKPAEGERT